MFSINTYNGTGVASPYAVTFPYLSKDHVEVRIGGVLQTSGFSWINSSTISVNAPVGINNVDIRRNTPAQLPEVVYSDGSTLTNTDLNLETTHLLYISQETSDRIEDNNNRTIHYPVGEVNTHGDLPLAGGRAGMILAFDAEGLPEMLPVTTSVGAGDLKNEVFTSGVDYTEGVSTTLTLSRAYGNKANLGAVVMQGNTQDPDSYSLDGLTLTFDAPIPAGVTKVWLTGGTTLSQEIVNDLNVKAGSKLANRINMHGNVKDPQFAAVGDGVTNDSPAFQAVENSVLAGKVLDVDVPAGTYFLATTVTPGAGTVNWRFASGASLAGPGKLSHHASPMSFNSTPNVGKRLGIWHGSDGSPTADGVTATSYMQRVDQSSVPDDPAHLIFLQYNALKRKAGGTGWLTTNYNYLEDASTSGAAQSVAVAGSAHATGNASVWGLYGEGVSSSATSTITACELDAMNFSGVHYAYNDTYPVTLPFSCALWAASVGNAKNSFAIGVGLAGSVANNWHVGIYMQTFSVDHIGIDMQCQPPTLINFKYGASTDGTGITPGGIGLDVGRSSVAAYGVGPNQCAIHLRDQRLGFGDYAFMAFNPFNNLLEFWTWNGSTYVRRGFLDMGGADHAI